MRIFYLFTSILIIINVSEINSKRHARWPKNSDGIAKVFYEINGFSPTDTAKIRLAMSEVNDKTCVRFVERKNETDYVEVFLSNNCGAQIGYLGGRQEFSMSSRWCPVQHGMVLHDLLHILGFEHMHQHPERDNFVNIFWENMIDDVNDLYERIDDDRFESFMTPYDYQSVMHFGNVTFSKNGEQTLEAKDEKFKDKIGQRKALSDGDVKRINRMYKCDGNVIKVKS